MNRSKWEANAETKITGSEYIVVAVINIIARCRTAFFRIAVVGTSAYHPEIFYS